jgi:F-type H+-transporting ATPase subunit epsilon
MASSTPLLQLRVVSQEKELLNESVEQVTLPTTSGEITVLAGHVPLFSQIKTGTIAFKIAGEERFLVVSRGFLDVTPDNQVVVMVDSGTLDRDISEQAAEKAVAAAHETMSKTTDQREMLMVEASLKRAMLELQIAQRSKKARI